MTNWSEADLAAKGYRKDGSRDPAPSGKEETAGGPAGGVGERPPPAGANNNKYGAIRTIVAASWGGERMADSKAGAELSQSLVMQRQLGGIVDFFEEVSVPIGVNEKGKIVRYRADAMVILGHIDIPGTEEPALIVRFLDKKRKDYDTPTSKAKRAALRQRGLNVEVV